MNVLGLVLCEVSVRVYMQEPDSYGIRWEPSATRPGYGALMLDLMDALYPIIPGSLYFIEGVDQECESSLILGALVISLTARPAV